MELNFFDTIEYLEPKCQNCGSVLEYGVNTHYDKKSGSHICSECGTVLK